MVPGQQIYRPRHTAQTVGDRGYLEHKPPRSLGRSTGRNCYPQCQSPHPQGPLGPRNHRWDSKGSEVGDPWIWRA